MFPESNKLRLGAAFAAQAAGAARRQTAICSSLMTTALMRSCTGAQRIIFGLPAMGRGNAICGSTPSSAIGRPFWTGPAIRSSVWNRGRRCTGSVGGCVACAIQTVLQTKHARDNGYRLLVRADACQPLSRRNGLGCGCRDHAVSAPSVPARIPRQGRLLRLTGTRRNSAAHQLSLVAETGVSQFHLGPRAGP